MVMTFTILLIGIGYIFYQSKDEVYLIQEDAPNEKDEMYVGLDDLYI